MEGVAEPFAPQRTAEPASRDPAGEGVVQPPGDGVEALCRFERPHRFVQPPADARLRTRRA